MLYTYIKALYNIIRIGFICIELQVTTEIITRLTPNRNIVLPNKLVSSTVLCFSALSYSFHSCFETWLVSEIILVSLGYSIIQNLFDKEQLK